MTLEDLASLAQIFAAITVIPSLLFVGLQLRDNSHQLRIATAAGYYEIYRDHALASITPELADVFTRGFEGQEGLDEVERVQLNSYFAVITRGYQVLHHQAGQKVFDASFWQSAQNHYADLLQSKGYQQYWATRRHHFNPTFQAFTDRLISDHPKVQLWGLGDKIKVESQEVPPPSPVPSAATDS